MASSSASALVTKVGSEATVDVAATTGGVAATVSNPMTAAEETVAEEIGIVPSATIPTSPSGPNATGAENPVATPPPSHAMIAEATLVTAETIEAETVSAHKGVDGMTDEGVTGIAPSATIPTSPSGPNATVAVSPVATLEDPLETIDEVDLTVAVATVMVVSSGGTTVATETVVATNPSLAIGPATIAAPTISRAGRRATSVDLTLRTVAATGAVATAEVHAKAKASEAATAVAVTDVDPGNNVLSEEGTAVDHDKTVISEKKAEGRATVVATIAEARGKTVVAVGRAAFDQKGPSVRHRVSLVGTLTTVGQNPSADGAVMTIEGEAYG